MESVVYFHPKNDYTGSTRVLANILSSTNNNKEIVVVTDMNNRAGFLSEVINVKIINTGHPLFKGRIISVLTSVGWLIYVLLLTLYLGVKFDHFYINTIQPFYAAIVGRFMHKQITYHVHEIFLPDSMSKKLALFFFDKIASHRIFVSHYAKAHYKNNTNCTWEVKYNKLNRDFVDRVKIVPINRRKKRNVLMVSSLSKSKGIDTFIKLAESIPELNFHLVLSSERKLIDDYFTEYIPSNVWLYPSQSDVSAFYLRSDIILNLSIPSLCVETFGLTILEAMAYGIPAVVPNVGGPVELVKDGYNGMCVDVTNIECISNAIMTILGGDKYQWFCENALNRYKDCFE